MRYLNIFLATSLTMLSACGGNSASTTTTTTPLPQSAMSILAGSIDQAGNLDATGSNARFQRISAITVDLSGNVYVTDKWSCIRKITPLGITTTLAGTCGQFKGRVDGVGAAASFSDPRGLATDSSGNIFVADIGIRKISPTGMVTTLENSGPPKNWDGQGPTFGTPYRAIAVAVDKIGHIYASYTGDPNTVIQKMSATGVTSIFAGIINTPGATDGAANVATFSNPIGLTTDNDNNLYIAENSIIRKATPAALVSTLAGSAGKIGNVDGNADAARFTNPEYITTDQTGNVYVTDAINKTVRKITPARMVSTLVGETGNTAATLKVLPTNAFNLGGIAVRENILYLVHGTAILKIQL